MDLIGVINLTASLASLILSVVAIWLALHFYNQTKGVETNVRISLEAIKTQTEALQSLNATTLNRLTKFVTTPRDDTGQAAQATQALASTFLRDLPDIVLKLRIPDTSNEAALHRQTTELYVALWNYIGLTNIWGAFALPNLEDFDETERNHKLARHIVDRSAADFRYVQSIVDEIDLNDIHASQNLHLYEEALTFIPHIGDALEIFARRVQQG